MSHTQFFSFIPGFQIYDSVPFSVDIPSQSIASGATKTFDASVGLSRSDTIVQMKIKYDGLETFWRDFGASLSLAYPSHAAIQYQYGSFYRFNGTSLVVTTFFYNATAGSITIPAITVRCKASLFVAPG